MVDIVRPINPPGSLARARSLPPPPWRRNWFHLSFFLFGVVTTLCCLRIYDLTQKLVNFQSGDYMHVGEDHLGRPIITLSSPPSSSIRGGDVSSKKKNGVASKTTPKQASTKKKAKANSKTSPKKNNKKEGRLGNRKKAPPPLTLPPPPKQPSNRSLSSTITDEEYSFALHDTAAPSFRPKYHKVIKYFVDGYHGGGGSKGDSALTAAGAKGAAPVLQVIKRPKAGSSGPFFAIWTEAGPKVNASAFTLDADGVVDAYAKGYNYIPPSSDIIANSLLDEKNEVVVVHGDHAAFHGWFPNVGAHVVDYHLAQIAFLKENVSDKIGILLLDVGSLRDILSVLDPGFAKRVTWLKPREIVRLDGGGTLTVVLHKSGSRIAGQPLYGASGALHRWLVSLSPPPLPDLKMSDDKTVIFYSRVTPQGWEGRTMDADHNRDIAAAIQRSMDLFRRRERLVVFDGTTILGEEEGNEQGEDAQRQPMTFLEQFWLFRSATAVIGPHGTPLANILWMGLPETTKDGESSSVQKQKSQPQRPKVLEFTVGPNNTAIAPRPFALTYAYKYWGLPFEYHHLLYAANSTKDRTFVDLQSLEDALEILWLGQ